MVDELLAAWNDHDVDRTTPLLADDFIGIDLAHPAPIEGPEGYRQVFQNYVRAFPDLSLTCESVLEQDNRIVFFWQARGTHRGAFMNIPPTGHTFSVRGVTLLTLHLGKIFQSYCQWDVAGLFRAMHLLPEL